ncbi:hypothetical protein ACIRVK_35180 [Streptomyces sp. NPDC101152]|uniref:hypothetical protein n=1 Tax=Streptomyces sp. NPDC101152 TaxID=3366116 RepID=UPI0037F14399
MSNNTATGAAQAVDRWLKDQYLQLRSGLSLQLDVDSGLGEARSHARQAELVHGLDRILAPEAGLAAILRPRLRRMPGLPAAVQDQLAEHSPMIRSLRAVCPATRLSVRANPDTTPTILGILLVRVLDLAVALSLDHDRSHARARDLAHALALDLARVRDRAVDPGVAGAHSRALELAHAIDVDINFDLDHLARDIAGDQALTLAHSLASGVEATLADDLDQLRTRDRDRLRDLLRARTRSRALAATHTRAIAALLDLTTTTGLADALLSGALDDFTNDDLSEIELTGTDLVGILWSADGTRWPRGTDMDELRARSLETPPDSGVYVVTEPPRVGARQ